MEDTTVNGPLPVKRRVRRVTRIKLENRGIPKSTFERIVSKMIAQHRCVTSTTIPKIERSFDSQTHRCDVRVQDEALAALKQAAEEMLVSRFNKCQKAVDLCKMDTLRKEHWDFVQDTEGLPC
jgi:histone H3/H4